MRAILSSPMIDRYRGIQPSARFSRQAIAAGQEKGALSVSGLGGTVVLQQHLWWAWFGRELADGATEV